MNSYPTVKSEKKYSGAILDVFHDTITLPDGRNVIREVVHHVEASAIIPIDNDGKIIMVRQYRHPAKAMVLEIPAGVMDEGEGDPQACAARELEEETGYKAGKLTFVTVMYSAIGFCNERIHLYIAENLIESQMNLDEDEFITLERYSVEEATEMIFNGKIVDSKTMLAILAYRKLSNTL